MMRHTICLVPTEATVPRHPVPVEARCGSCWSTLLSTPAWQNTYPSSFRGLYRLVTGQRAVGVPKALARSSRQWEFLMSLTVFVRSPTHLPAHPAHPARWGGGRPRWCARMHSGRLLT
ncbi:hypothetical protein CGRA01v4_13562 [Colletotrichum graminicola]|nr:hypothetical protein CGRA01v4_13562 [Colletotrichum graminicola]